jgi:preprotein translocase subunit YajC
MLISSAYAQAAGGAAGMEQFMGLLPIILMFVLLYFLMIRPQMKRAKEHRTMTEGLQKGDEVVAGGGFLGKITKVGDAYVNIEVASGTELTVQRGSIVQLLPKGTLKSAQ